MTKNIFVLGLTELQRGELGTVRHAADNAVHNLLDTEDLVDTDEHDFDALLAAARRQLDAFPDSVDAIISHWDFPTSVLGPILAAEHGLPSPSLKSILTCEHKYWSRLEQAASVPEVVPEFCKFDPFADDPLSEVTLDFPFWVKPVKSHSSMLGFQVADEAEFKEAVDAIREGIGPMAQAFDRALAQVDLPETIIDAPGATCLAEGLVEGIQAAPEGNMFMGEFRIHGVFDMHKEAEGHSFSRLDYPAGTVPQQAQDRMCDVSERYLRHIGFDNGCFNTEFMWDPDTDKLWLIEVNTRISQSHSDLFAKVDGMSNHEAAIDIALGRSPTLPQREGRFAVAAKCLINHEGDDAVIRRVPTEDELAELAERYPETQVELAVSTGDRLSDLPHQDAYTYELGVLYIGANDREELGRIHRACLEELNFEFDPVS